MFHCPDFPWQLYLGRELSCVADVQSELLEASKLQFDFISLPLVHPRFTSPLGVQRTLPLTRSDYCLPSDKWNRFVYGRVTEVDVDAADPLIRDRDETVLREQLQWGIHLGVNTLVLPAPRTQCANYAHIVNQFLANGLYYQNAHVRVEANEWENWNTFRLCCGPATSLGVQLVLGREVPTKVCRRRWLGEPVRSVLLPRASFICNKGGYPVLSK